MKSIKVLLYVFTPVFIFILSAYLAVSLLLKTQQTTICPDLRGKTVEEARQLAGTRGLSFSILRYERRNDVPYNHITVQKPEANINTRKGRVVYVIVSEGPELIKTPGLVGQGLEAARSVLEEKRLILDKIITIPHSKTGRVIAQLPAEGTEILQQTKVTLIVGSEQKTYFFLSETKNIDINGLAEEMDAKKIKYKMNYVRADHTPRSGIDFSVPPRTVFSGSDELIITIY
jgi:beta-lactam-binding protein with PASTA domain